MSFPVCNNIGAVGVSKTGKENPADTYKVHIYANWNTDAAIPSSGV